ncbi:LamG-like jellyroll fold domain-containing protein [Geminisphaera colitermitum]|uniref:LamG-like jellyroll fold domain-containing protein n=1 Tax=Geminisphaera colitermitum TaxID=1148786 RepID=UPI000158CD02|nr:LamG-like jellyroll fold domain-containing protein [Geminisphaera colitermitum]
MKKQIHTSIKGTLLALTAFVWLPCAFADAYSDAVLGDNPLVYFRFDGSGSTVTNSGSATTISGTLAGWTNATNVTQNSDNGLNGASFPGLDATNTGLALTRSTTNPAGVSINNATIASAINGQSAVSVEFFFKNTASMGGTQTIFNIPGYTSGSYAAGLVVEVVNSDLRITGRSVGTDTFANVNKTFAEVLPSAGTWVHIVAIFDIGNDSLKIYKNGALFGTQSIVCSSDTINYTSSTGSTGSSELAWIGRNGNSTAAAANPIGASIDEFAIYKGALSADAIAAHYAAAITAVPEPATTGLLVGGAMALLIFVLRRKHR